ncbi:MAG: hypothetical protein Q8P82_03065 [bacterium]|nr:hypothetical protein [bacterium]
MRRIAIYLLLLPLLGVGCGTKSPPAPTAESSTIEYRDGVFSPREVKIGVGGTVIFKNVGTTPVWPASDAHPTHLRCPGFDALRSLNTGEIYSFTFIKAETCPFHNHLSATETGTIVVK